MKRNWKKYFLNYCLGQKPFLSFLKIKKYKTTSNFEFYFGSWSLMWEEGSCQLSKKNIHFQGPCDFLNMKILLHKIQKYTVVASGLIGDWLGLDAKIQISFGTVQRMQKTTKN